MWSRNNRYFKFFQKVFLFINNYLVPFKVTPLRCNTLMPAFFPILETLLKHAVWCRQQLLFRFFFYLLNQKKKKKLFLFIGVFSFGKRKKSAKAKYGKYGGWGMITVLILVKNSRTSIDVWPDALSRSKIHDWIFHNSVRLWRIASSNRRITSG